MRLESPYDEVTVTRRYYRAGESEYYINRKAVRLRDIYELFLNTGVGRDGYSIIGQGKIAEMVSRKSEERRTVFEDASGIAKFRHKKSETERKLAATEDNMTRVNDIFLEVEAQIGPLEKDAEKAKRAIELLEIKKRVDVQLWLYDTEKLRADILSRAETIINIVGEIEERSPVTVQEYRDRLYAKLSEVLQSTSIDEQRILTEAAIFADKVAVDEELVRLESHFKAFDEAMNSSQPVGRRLDFLLQEMNREVNTTGSKCNDSSITALVVDAKCELEKIREQIQNLE
jgi:chromosome segregation protein